jgi:hypothetical protein
MREKSKYHITMNNGAGRVTMEKITRKADEIVNLKVSKNVLAKLKREAGIVGKASPSRIVQAYIKTTLNLNDE